MLNKLKCLVYSHDWEFQKSLSKYGATTISKGRPTNSKDFKGNLYKCRRCGKMDKV